MPCDTCGHTVQNIGNDITRKFWCPRCGTFLTLTGQGESEHRNVEPPALVVRVKALLDHLPESIAAMLSTNNGGYQTILGDLRTLAESVGVKKPGEK